MSACRVFHCLNAGFRSVNPACAPVAEIMIIINANKNTLLFMNEALSCASVIAITERENVYG